MFTWPPTEDGPRARANTQSFNLPSVSASRLQTSLLETQETQETASYNCSDASSIGRFPAFSFSLHSISSLSSLRTKGKGTGQKVAVLLATLEVEGPDTIRIKQGKDAGKEVSLLKMILGDEEGNVCKLTAWREIADTWGGNDVAPSVKRGDIVYIESTLAPLVALFRFSHYSRDQMLRSPPTPPHRCLSRLPHISARSLTFATVQCLIRMKTNDFARICDLVSVTWQYGKWVR